MHLRLIRPIALMAILLAISDAPAVVSTAGSRSRPSTCQAPPGAAQAQEQSMTMVSVDFRALARDGTPVLDLKPEEVALKVGGRARDIVALELVKAGETRLRVRRARRRRRRSLPAVPYQRPDRGRPERDAPC